MKSVHKHFLMHTETVIFKPIHRHFHIQSGVCSLTSPQNTLPKCRGT